MRQLSSGSGWAVTDTAPGEWLEFEAVDFSAGNYELIANYATAGDTVASTPVSKRLQGRIPRASIYENFSMDDLNGGSLVDGDVVNLQAYDGYYVTADAASGMLTATARAPDSGAAFTIKSLQGSGDIADGQSIALQAADGAHYLTVGPSPDQIMAVSGTSIGADQTFVISLSPQSPQ